MRRSIFALLILPAAALAQAEPDIPKGEVAKYAFNKSKIFPGTVRDYWVYVPKQYDPSKPACLYVNQDGIQFNAPVVFDRLIQSGAMPPTIGVFVRPGVVKAPNPEALDRFNRSYEYDGLGDAYARFLIEELLPEVETKTTSDGRPIRISKDGNDRAIGGSSSGAIAAFTAAWERPDSFRRVFSSIGTYVGLRGGNEYATLVRKVEPKPIRVFLQDGSNDLNIYGGDWWIANQALERSLAFAGYEVNHIWGTGGHDGKHATEIFPEAMTKLWAGWPAPVKAGAGSQQLREIVRAGEGWTPVGGEYGPVETMVGDASGAIHFETVRKEHVKRIAPDGSLDPAPSSSLGLGGRAFGPDGAGYTPVLTREGLKFLAARDAAGRLRLVRPIDDFVGLLVRHDGRVYSVDAASDRIEAFTPGDELPIPSQRIPARGILALSPDQTLLYVSEGRSRWIWSYQIQPDGRLAFGQRYDHLHVPDDTDVADVAGLATDRDGRLYAATSLGIQVCDQPGRVNVILPVPGGKATALAFGGPEGDMLYVAAGDRLYRRNLKVRGARPFEKPIKPPTPRL